MSYEQQQQHSAAYTGSRDIDVGLQSFMRGVYNTMSLGLVLTGLVAYAVSSIEPVYNAIFGNMIVAMAVAFLPLIFIMFGLSPGRVAKMNTQKVTMYFIAFSALMGISLASIFMHYSTESIARVFFITSGTFAATSLFGYTTKRNLTGMGSFMMMGLWGVIIASVVNMFLGWSMLHFVTSLLSVAIFTGLTAYETQMLKETYSMSRGDEANGKIAVMGALNLYLSFINLFMALMHLMGSRD